MRKNFNSEEIAPVRVKRGRAVLVGYGLDNDGHFRYTRGETFELYGGSSVAHEEMQRRAMAIQDEIASLGISLEGMTYEQFQVVRGIVERANAD